jgi:hypothetical protein
MSAPTEGRINTKAQSMLLDAVARHLHEVQICAIVIVEDDPGSDSRLSVQQPQMCATIGIGHKVDTLAIAWIARTAGSVQPQAHVPARIEADAEALAAGSIPDDHPCCGGDAIEVVADGRAQDDSGTAGTVFNDELAGSKHIGRTRSAQECGGDEDNARDAYDSRERAKPL